MAPRSDRESALPRRLQPAPTRPAGGADSSTRERLLDAAEELFARRGIDATSLRAVTSHAGANLAAVNYHFGSKDELIEAILSRRVEPINRERLERLAAIEAESSPAPAVETILDALVRPALSVVRADPRRGRLFLSLVGRVYSEPNPRLQQFVVEQFQTIYTRFTEALRRALPALSRTEIAQRFQFAVGAMVHTIADPAHLRQLAELSGRNEAAGDAEVIAERLVAFLAAGFRAPPSSRARSEDAP